MGSRLPEVMTSPRLATRFHIVPSRTASWLYRCKRRGAAGPGSADVHIGHFHRAKRHAWPRAPSQKARSAESDQHPSSAILPHIFRSTVRQRIPTKRTYPAPNSKLAPHLSRFFKRWQRSRASRPGKVSAGVHSQSNSKTGPKKVSSSPGVTPKGGPDSPGSMSGSR